MNTPFLSSLAAHDAPTDIPDGCGAYGTYDPPCQPGKPPPTRQDERARVEAVAERVRRELREGAQAGDFDFCVCGKPAIVVLQQRALCEDHAPLFRRELSDRKGVGRKRGWRKASRPVKTDRDEWFPSIREASEATSVGIYAIRQSIRRGFRGGGRRWEWATTTPIQSS